MRNRVIEHNKIDRASLHPFSGVGLGVGSHVLDYTRFTALDPGDTELVVFGTGVYFQGFGDRGSQVGLRCLSGEVRARDFDLQGRIVRCSGYYVIIFGVHFV